jgi:hypothetical protein
MRASVEVHVPDLPPERHVLGRDPTRIGTGAGATFCPRGAERLGDAFVILDASADGCRVTLIGEARATIAYAGTEHRCVHVRWGEEVFVSAIRFAFVLESDAPEQTSPVLAIAALLLGVSLVSWLASEPEVPSTEAAPPSLAVAAPCPAPPASAAREAGLSEAIGRSKYERYPFVRREGPEALRLLTQAQACYSIAGLIGDARRADTLVAAVLRQLDTDYAALRARLRLSLARNQWSETAATAKALVELLGAHQHDAYVTWLGRLARDARQRATRLDSSSLGRPDHDRR